VTGVAEMFDVTAIGELLIDFTPAGNSAAGDLLFARKPGGAPANVLTANSKLGGKTSFIGKVGNDMFGRFLKNNLESSRIDTTGVIIDQDIPTTLAFVQLDDRGDRSFSFYRKPGADLMLQISDIKENMMTNCHIFHFGSVSLTDDPSRSATLFAVDTAKKAGCIVSYDPNYRPALWDNVETAKEQMKAGLALADIVKVSEEEMVLLTGKTDLREGSNELARYGASLVLISLGPKGAFYRKGGLYEVLPTYNVKTVDTNGAGDSFLGAVHYRLRGKTLAEIQKLSQDDMEDIISFANAAGSLTTTKGGAIPAMPTLKEIELCRKTVPLLK
jgi:fructokinase